MSSRYRLARLLLLCPLLSLPPSQHQAAAPPADKGKPARRALLIGCTRYDTASGFSSLDGPINDVADWKQMLTEPTGFAFPEANIVTLVGWPDSVRQRPTYANIVREFEELIRVAGPDDRIFILMSGHGSQVPLPPGADPFDPRNPEPDGLDEVFIPSDVGKWEDTTKMVPNLIPDDRIGAWLDQLRACGAHVWIVFDCCHSGTMTRGDVKGRREVSRSVDPQALGVPDKALETAAAQAGQARGRVLADVFAWLAAPGLTSAPAWAARGGLCALLAAPALAPERSGDADVLPRSPGRVGSVVATYGAQSFESALEMALPDGVPDVPRNRRGLLSFHLIQALTQRERPLTYRELGRLLGGRLKADRGLRGPTPYFEGELDREVLGLSAWPRRPDIVLEKPRRDEPWVNRGSMSGLLPGAVLAVYPPPGAANPKRLLGHLKVKEAQPLTATVEPCPHDGRAAVKLETLPVGAVCRVVFRDFGESRVKLFLGAKDDPVRKAWAALKEPVKAMVRLVEDEAEAEWVLRTSGPRVLLLEGRGAKLDERLLKEEAAAAAKKLREGKRVKQRSFGEYAAADAKHLADELERDLPKLFRWQNLWKVAGKVDGAGREQGPRLEVRRSTGPKDQEGVPLGRPVVAVGERLLLRISNEGYEGLWCTLLLLSADLEIQVVNLQPLRREREVSVPLKVSRRNNAIGAEGVILLASPMSKFKVQPDFALLAQTAFQVKGRSAVRPKAPGGRPFERLLFDAAFGSPRMRSATPVADDDPTILTFSFLTVETRP